MQTRTIKFRAWDQHRNKMIHTFHKKYWQSNKYRIIFNSDKEMFCGNYKDNGDWNEPILMQYTGKHDINNKEVYEGDIIRDTIEENFGDVNFYYVVTWINEWAMFGLLSYDEHQNYLDQGAKILDESMFWTFPLEDIDKLTICGNIYEHPDYVRDARIKEEQS